MPSIVESLEVAVRRLAKSTPQIAENLSQLVGRVNRLVGDVETEPGQEPVTIAGTLAGVDETVRHIDEMVVALDSANLSKDARAAMRELKNTSAAITTLASRLEQRDGLVTRMERASTAVGDLAMGFGRSDRELAEALEDVGDAARAIRRLADALERDPDMLLKGRAELSP
jgi:paraquat-inducible protein B